MNYFQNCFKNYGTSRDALIKLAYLHVMSTNKYRKPSSVATSMCLKQLHFKIDGSKISTAGYITRGYVRKTPADIMIFVVWASLKKWKWFVKGSNSGSSWNSFLVQICIYKLCYNYHSSSGRFKVIDPSISSPTNGSNGKFQSLQ